MASELKIFLFVFLSWKRKFNWAGSAGRARVDISPPASHHPPEHREELGELHDRCVCSLRICLRPRHVTTQWTQCFPSARNLMVGQAIRCLWPEWTQRTSVLLQIPSLVIKTSTWRWSPRNRFATCTWRTGTTATKRRTRARSPSETQSSLRRRTTSRDSLSTPPWPEKVSLLRCFPKRFALKFPSLQSLVCFRRSAR